MVVICNSTIIPLWLHTLSLVTAATESGTLSVHLPIVQMWKGKQEAGTKGWDAIWDCILGTKLLELF